MNLRFSAFLVLISAACCITSLVSSSNDPYQSFQKIDSRASTCSDPTATQCGSEFPENFCCPSGTSCHALAENTTILCCPADNSCSVIKSISCDITQQNVTAHPGTPLMTTELSATLPVCASQCCPFGYSCNSNNDCALNQLQNEGIFTTSTASTLSFPTETSSLPRLSTNASLAPTAGSANSLPTSVEGQNFTPNALVTGDETTANADSITITVAAGSTAAIAVIMLWAVLFWRVWNYQKIRARKQQSMYFKAELDASDTERRHKLSSKSSEAHELMDDRVAYELEGTPIFALRGRDLKPLPEPPRGSEKTLICPDQRFLDSFQNDRGESTDTSREERWI